MDYEYKVAVAAFFTLFCIAALVLVYWATVEKFKGDTCYQKFYYNEAHKVLVPKENYCGKNVVGLKELEEK